MTQRRPCPPFAHGLGREFLMAQVSELAAVDRVECLRLLRTVSVGRIVFTEHALPAIQPVNFTVEGGEVFIRTSGGGN